MKSEIDEAAVWQRVTAAQEEPRKHNNPQQPLLSLIHRGIRLEQGYSGLCRSGKKQFQNPLLTQRQENRQLRGLYVLLFGTLPENPATEPVEKRGYEALLHRLIHLQQEQQEGLWGLARQHTGAQQQLFEGMGEQAAQRWALLLGELGRIS